jgi:CRP-like cAMP-binding protein
VEESRDVDWPLLAGIPEEDCQRFLAIARRRRFAKGEVVFHAGDRGDSLYLVARGRFAIRGGTVLGDTVMLRVIGTGSFFGELALVGDDRRSATVAALEPSETLTIVRQDFEELRARHTSVDRVLVAALAEQLRRTSDLLTEFLYLPAERRVLRRLLEVAVHPGGPGRSGRDDPTDGQSHPPPGRSRRAPPAFPRADRTGRPVRPGRASPPPLTGTVSDTTEQT